METYKHTSEKGQAILLSVIIMGSILLGVTTIAGYLSIQKVRVSRDIVNSQKAIYAADAGIEKELYAFFVDNTISDPTFSNEASLQTTSAPSIRSIGTAKASSRAFRLTISN